ncbi:hypothetical protein BME53_03910 [Klebsiella quasipneumoniae subsp. similipneumoniae]|nr:hypothetical protein BME54_20935 [Klebsiella quasipneumoniae]AZJ29148.1 hypothetical protein BME36_020575 [Klebsiella quasipneumoniae subsp. similipneumoniae]OVV93517.1 hypothetical protein BME61_29085 [Klebsiella quasipneumoniae subsp. similipneumoniae]OVW09711.1 hypothetical protein BME58_29075 [Klebsiella quasipneumoniae subsp. similipneumoniae]OVW14781.1 hypothetical protein BME56_30220 [Klebsiella quasipneumoniae subsp. similipneumoniae]
MRDLILQLSKSSIYSTKPLSSCKSLRNLRKHSSIVYKTINSPSGNDRNYSFINCNIINDHFIM